MDRLGLECLSGLGLDPVTFVHLAAELGCAHVSLNLGGAANRLPDYAEFNLRADSPLQRTAAQALKDTGVGLALLEGFAIMPDRGAADLAPDLDIAADMGARAICAVSMERDRPRGIDQFAALTEMASARGMLTTTEVGAGVLRNLSRSLEAVTAVANPDFKLLIDTMHFFRSGSDIADLAAIDPGHIGHVQLCDVPMPAEMDSYMEEALFERRAPGDGDLPLAAFVEHIPPGVVIGLEIPIRSEAEAGVGPRERLSRCVEAARKIVR